MPDTTTNVRKQYLDYAGLQSYDALLKTYIAEKDAEVNLKSIKNVALVENTLYFFNTTAVPVDANDVVDTTQALTSVELTTDKLQGIEDLIGTDALETTDQTLTGAINELNTALNNLAKIATTGKADDAKVDASIIKTSSIYGDDQNVSYRISSVEEGTKGSAQWFINWLWNESKTQKSSISDLAAKIATINNDSNGILAQAKDYTDEVVGDTTALETTDKSDIVAAVNELVAKANITVEKQETATDGYLSTYVIKQDGAAVGDAINIPKDFLVKSASVKTAIADDPSGFEEGTVFIDFVINTKDNDETDEHIYINVANLIDIYTAAADATQVQIAINENNEISATLVAGGVDNTALADGAVTGDKIAENTITNENIVDGTITNEKIVDGTITLDKISQEVKDTIQAGGDASQVITEKIEALDSTVSTITDENQTPDVEITIVQTDGKLESVVAEISTISADDIGNLFN